MRASLKSISTRWMRSELAGHFFCFVSRLMGVTIDTNFNFFTMQCMKMRCPRRFVVMVYKKEIASWKLHATPDRDSIWGERKSSVPAAGYTLSPLTGAVGSSDVTCEAIATYPMNVRRNNSSYNAADACWIEPQARGLSRAFVSRDHRVVQ